MTVTRTIRKTPYMKLIEARRGEPIEHLLRRLYVDEDKTLEQVSAELGVPLTTVARWIRQFGIPRRKLGWIPPGASDD